MKVMVEEIERNQEILLWSKGEVLGWADITFVWYDPGSVMLHTHIKGQGRGRMITLPNGTPVEVRDAEPDPV